MRIGRKTGSIEVTIPFDNGWYAVTRFPAIETSTPGTHWDPPEYGVEVSDFYPCDKVTLINDDLGLEFTDEYLGYKNDKNCKLNWDRIYKQIGKREYTEAEDSFEEDVGIYD